MGEVRIRTALRLLGAAAICAVMLPRASSSEARRAPQGPIIAHDAAGLGRAIRAARPGATIVLQTGDYGMVSIEDVDFARPVRIVAAAGARPVLRGLALERVRGLTLRGLEIQPQASPAVAARDSSALEFDALDVHGTPAAWGGLGLMIVNSSNVSVTNSEFHNLWGGVEHHDSHDLLIADNRLHNLQEDAIRGGGSSNVTITRNYVTDLFPQNGDHPDAIQFWGTPGHYSVANITVTDNAYIRGAGGKAQGIFVADGTYRNVRISGNVIVGSLYNGILVSGAEGGVIQDNLVEGYVDLLAWIAVAQSHNLQISNNRSTGGLTQPMANADLVQDANAMAPGAPVGDRSALNAWMAARSAQAKP